MSRPADVTEMLVRWSQGDGDALEKLVPILYDELRVLAARQFRSERSDHTLQPTAIVHETFLRLVRQDPGRVETRTHFFAVAAKVMRRVLVDHARKRNADKRVGQRQRVTYIEGLSPSEDRGVDLVALDDALLALAEFQPRAARLVELRYFGGLTLEEAAAMLAVSPSTVRRNWTAAKAWLRSQLEVGPDS